MAGERVVLVDGSSLIFRAYFAIPGNLTTSQGLHTNAIYGFTTMFRKLMAGKRPAFGAVAFDPKGKTFRNEKYPKYKAHRPRMGTDLREQLPWIDKVTAAFGFPILRVPGFEADDVIGTLTRIAVEAGHEVVIVSGDKDFAQLLSDEVRMYDSLREVTYEPELARKKWGVPPEQFVDYLALLGDKSDNIPGVPGIGAKGAAKLLETYGSLDGILEHTGELKGRQKKTLTDNRELALISRELATIELKVPLDMKLEDLAVPEPEPDALNALYKELEFYSLLSGEVVSADSAGPRETDYGALTDPAAARAALQALGAGEVALVPCFDKGPYNKPALVGLAVAGQAGTARYLPTPHLLWSDPVWAFLREWLEDPERPKTSHDAKALWVGLRRQGVNLRGVAFDSRLASFLIDPSKLIPHRLDQLVKEHLHRTVRPLKSIIGSGKKEIPFSEAELKKVADYACHLADALLELTPLVRDKLKETGLESHLHEIDLPLSWVLGEMELTGVRVDLEDLKALGIEFRGRLEGLVKRIHELAGSEFNVNSTKQLSKVLFEDLKLPVIKRTKTGYSTAIDVLERLQPKHEIAKVLVEQRKLAKLINTYTDVLQASADPETGRVHATFQQTSGVTGRLISTDPDLQRTPVKTPEGERIRRAFIPSEGCKLVAADWSQIELRLMAHVSEDDLLCESFREGLDVHARTASQLFHCPVEEVTKEQRRIGKTINFATTYGQGATALGQILGIKRTEAKAYIDGYFAAYAGVRDWLDCTVSEALETGYIETLFGRRRYVPELSSHDPMIRQAGMRIAANTPLQGSVADICKQAMLEIDRRLRADGLQAKMLMQIHDELVFDVPQAEVEQVSQIAREVMSSVVELRVPLVVDVGVGDNWAAAH